VGPVSWLLGVALASRPSHRIFPAVACMATKLPSYSGASAPALHRFPAIRRTRIVSPRR